MAQTSTVTSVASSATSVQLFAAVDFSGGSARTIWNDSLSTLYVKFGTGATSASYTVQLAPGAFYEFQRPAYTGLVHGIWSSANGAALCTEIVG